MKLTKSKNKVAKIKDPSCLNCGHPFFGQEKFCPECGQANKGNSITFKSFINEVFNGLFNFDAKFWNTIIPLLMKPGIVSKNYIDGKRSRYSNPFRFYLTVSIIFFLILGISMTKDKYEVLAEDSADKIVNEINKEKAKKEFNEKEIDSVKNNVAKVLEKSFIPLPKKTKEKVLEEVEKEIKKDKDTTKKENNNFNITINEENNRLNSFLKYQKENPKKAINVALDSLGFKKNFTNRFLYTRAKAVNSLATKDSREEFLSQIVSYSSVALFILLPFFTLFLKLFYIRRKYTYVDHLIFVFHIQTVFFMLFSIYFILEILDITPETWIFLALFLMYLIIAMKKFYQQGYLKTIVKFCLLNFSYSLLAIIGFSLLSIISLMLF
ncbi:DUF3667 domain-containing protein [Polaribacter sp.]|uniref:DUF3667 domain-containing protein n=1 Tax=Polaribacter sp. TaxID=1920175 RepID=UPI003F6A36F7